MAETIQLGEIAIALTRKDVKHVHLSVHPPSGPVTLVAPNGTRREEWPVPMRSQARMDPGPAGKDAGPGATRQRASSSSAGATIYGADATS